MPKALVFYHYFHPDDVVSAQHLSQFCEELHARGWQVTAAPCNRGCRDERQAFRLSEDWNGIEIRRVWRPRFRQASAAGRVLNAAWMLAAWGLLAFRRRLRPDVVIVGTDPIGSVLAARVWKAVRPRVKVAHWCFDLYPEAAVADGLVAEQSAVVRIVRRLLASAYQSCDLLADIGSCMRSRLSLYRSPARRATLVPWSLVEPDRAAVADPAERQRLFGDARLGLLYSGNFGRAHSYEDILKLARALRGQGVKFAFSVRGNGVDALKKALSPADDNVFLVPFAAQEQLLSRLSAADIHLASLRSEWTGTVVPSKFFGSLAAGRPVIFSGRPDSAIAEWIQAHGVGWVLHEDNADAVAAELRALADSRERLLDLQHRCHRTYQEHFSRARIMDAWDAELRRLIGAEPERRRPATA